MKHEIPGQSKVIPGSPDKLLKLVKSLDCPEQPWTVGNYVIGSNCSGVVREFIALHPIQEDLLFFYGSGGGPDIYNNFGHAPAGQVA